ncbi:MAG: Flp pilus assembly complex ATPase component TadA [Clostridiales bacterium]|nr:Flp pilus assembly complex ATPase component TadA [Clostridiales bacterium]
MDNSIKKLLPARIISALDKLDCQRVYEIRLRQSGVSVNYGGRFFGLSDIGLCSVGFKVSAAEIEDVVLKASGFSIYAVNDQIKNGFLSLSSGVRIGICGEVVDGKTIKNFTSLNIRFPHEVKGCADKVVSIIAKSRGCYNTLIVSPPGCGKTTLLRDLIRQLSDKGNNVLVADERYEIAAYHGGASLDVGKNTDVISGGAKSFAFNQGIRYMRPDVLAADEIMSDEDIKSVQSACAGGVNVIATLHASGSDFKHRFGDSGLIERIVVLSDKGGPGHIEGVFDGKYGRIA